MTLSCRGVNGREDTSEPSTSPQANIVPAPLTTTPTPARPLTATAGSAGIDAGPPPSLAHARETFPPDPQSRDAAGYSLQVALRFPDAPPLARGELPAAPLDAARKRGEPNFSVDLAGGRARIVLRGRGFLLPEGTEVRMRNDVYGSILLADGDASYRVLPPGTLRALFNERRIDVAPLTPAELTPSTESPVRRLGYPTRKVDVWTRAAKATFEIARVQDAGDGGVLLCRFLLDWMSAPPSTPLCADGDVPLHAELQWTPRGALVFDAVSIVRRLEIPAPTMQAPPAASRFTLDPLPSAPGGLFLTAAEALALRPGGDTSRLVLVNPNDVPEIAWFDGVPLGWVAPSSRLEAPGLPKVKMTLEWRTFFDDADKLPSQVVVLPASTDASGSDAGP